MLNLQKLLNDFNLQQPQKLTLVNAQALQAAHVPPFQADISALLWDETPLDVDAIYTILRTTYADSHPIQLADQSGAVTDATLGLLVASGRDAQFNALYLPPLEEGTSLPAFREIIAHLRAPDGCPWDKKQTHKTLRSHLLEEAYESLDAIDACDFDGMTEEFGDLLLQIVLHAQIASESDNFKMSEIIKGVYDKIIRRHPHVFGERSVDGVDEVLANWEKLKAQERKDNGKPEKGILDGVPLSFPALNQAQEYQDRAARVGFDWDTVDGVLDKMNEEIEEIRQAKTEQERAYEIGDLFFVLVNFARWQGVDAESALREANLRFKKRFKYIEQQARQQERPLQEMSLDEMEALWVEAKESGL